MNLFGIKTKSSPAPPPPRPRADPQAQDAHLLPRDPATGEPLAPIPQPGFYPGFSTLSQKNFWDETTRRVVVQRVEDPPPIRHFSRDQANFWRVVFDHLLPQTDRTPDRRIPLVEPLDQRLYEGRSDGYRYSDMPTDPEAYRLGQQAIDAESNTQFGGDFLYLPFTQQDLVLKAIHDGKPQSKDSEPGKSLWQQMSVKRFWDLMLHDAIEAYYAHPWAWDEIGFGGPAYPRAYTRLERGEPEPWEVEESRYEWSAPPAAVSGEVSSGDNQTQSHEGSGGTH